MTEFWPGLACFLIAFGAVWTDDITRRMSKEAALAVAGIALGVSIMCIALGAFHALTHWGFIDLHAAARSQGKHLSAKESVFLTIVEFWPFVMIVVGLLGALVSGRSLRARVAG